MPIKMEINHENHHLPWSPFHLHLISFFFFFFFSPFSSLSLFLPSVQLSNASNKLTLILLQLLKMNMKIGTYSLYSTATIAMKATPPPPPAKTLKRPLTNSPLRSTTSKKESTAT